MNNSQFRKLLVNTPARPQDGNPNSTLTPARGNATPALGSRLKSAIPMTPRSVVGSSSSSDFARQLFERSAAASLNPAPKSFKSRTAKGSKLASGYTDRTKTRRTEDEEDDKARRIKSLEEMVKLQQLDQATFETLRDEIVGGDVSSVHLVKGLDRKLLERVRRGEDVLAEKPKNENEEAEAQDVDYALDELEDVEVTAKKREETKKKGEMAPPSLIPGQKRTRDTILAEMKAARAAAKEKAMPSLGSKFKKVGAPTIQSRIERDGKGREILITIDESGNEKRKVRKVQSEPGKGHGLLMPDKDIAPLGMEVPEELRAAPEKEEEDVDIFDDVGDDYDPLAGLSGSESEGDTEVVKSSENKDEAMDEIQESEDGEVLETASQDTTVKTLPTAPSMPPPPLPLTTRKSRNYFNTPREVTDSTASTISITRNDPTILAAIKKASSLKDPALLERASQTEEEKVLAEKRKRMLQNDDRDMADMDMGFGSSRFEDEIDFEEGGKGRLAEWDGGDEGEEESRGGKGEKAKRKRGGKKRKGDGNRAEDVLKVLEARKAREG